MKRSNIFILIQVCTYTSLSRTTVVADVYLHNPRGSNNRVAESTRARANANNICDTQNNERGGYNLGSVFYYQGSTLSIEWTNQHSCGHENNHCEFILQYMCDDSVRDGNTTKTIPADRTKCQNSNCDTDRRYRMHENYKHYLTCATRQRNKELFIADQAIKNDASSRYTRQNPDATRYGYECAEERDYYPHWHPSPWKDIAIMTNDVSRCKYYQRESQNVKPKGQCVFDANTLEKIYNKHTIPNNKEDCENFELPEPIESNVRKPTWREFAAHGIPAPDCRDTEYTPDNHLGNGISGFPNTYNWTIPEYVQGDTCVIRIRYNISTTDYDPWSTDSTSNADPKKRARGSKVDMTSKFGFSTEKDARNRGYVFKNNPVVKVFDGLDLDLRLAINTAQYGRVFQDRSHTFAVQPLTERMKSGANIHNLNVKGKRGNIVQVYPSVMYDFHPNNLEISSGDYVHVQWTGSNTNNNGDDGQGKKGTDRSNIVLLSPPSGNGSFEVEAFGHYGNNYPYQGDHVTFLGISKDDAIKLAYSGSGRDPLLNDADTYFNLPPIKVTQNGTYHYMSTRNNAFAERLQKGKVIVNDFLFITASIGKLGGSVVLGDGEATLLVPENVFISINKIRIEKLNMHQGLKAAEDTSGYSSNGDDYASDFFVLSPESLVQVDMSQENVPPKTFTFEISVTDDDVSVYHINSDTSVWTQVPADIDGGKARIEAYKGGIYVARKNNHVSGMIVGIVVACLVGLAIVAGTIFYFRRNPAKWKYIKVRFDTAKLSVQNKV